MRLPKFNSIVFSQLWKKNYDIYFNYNMQALIIFLEISIIHKNNRAKKTRKPTRVYHIYPLYLHYRKDLQKHSLGTVS